MIINLKLNVLSRSVYIGGIVVFDAWDEFLLALLTTVAAVALHPGVPLLSFLAVIPIVFLDTK